MPRFEAAGAHLSQSRQSEGWRELRKCGSDGGQATTTALPQVAAGYHGAGAGVDGMP